MLPDQEESNSKIYIIGTRKCNLCGEWHDQLKKEEMKKVLKEKFRTDKVDVLYGDDDTEDGNHARNLCYSIDKFGAPMLVLERREGDKIKVCLLNEDLEEARCGLYKELPL